MRRSRASPTTWRSTARWPGSSSAGAVTFGIVAVRAGSKNACAATASAGHDVRDPDLIGAPHEQQAENQAAAHQVRGHHDAAPVHAVDHDARQRTDQRDRQHLDDQHPRHGRGRAGQVEQQRIHGNGVEPVAELRNRLADVQQPEVPVTAQEREIRIHVACASDFRGTDQYNRRDSISVQL